MDRNDQTDTGSSSKPAACKRRGEKKSGQIVNLFLSLLAPASPAVSSASENRINIFEFIKLCIVSKAEVFPTQRR